METVNNLSEDVNEGGDEAGHKGYGIWKWENKDAIYEDDDQNYECILNQTLSKRSKLQTCVFVSFVHSFKNPNLHL